ncbi:MAG: LptF/LptG family permease [Candidatus Margulisiibacteriota bacterium]|jgi:lipopolysaccharide export system permease protein
MLKLLDRYIMLELVGPFFYGLAAFSCIMTGSTILFGLVGTSVKYGIPLLTTLQILAYRFPAVLVFTFPMSMLLASIMAMGRLSGDQEITALKASGIGVSRILLPVVAMGLSVSLLTIAFNEIIVPRASSHAETILQNFISQEKPQIQQNVNLTTYTPDGAPLRIINVQNADQGQLKGITVAEFEDTQLARIIRAQSGHWDSAGKWALQDGIMHYFPPKDPLRLTVIEFKKEDIYLNISPADLTKREKTLEELNSAELRGRITQRRITGQDTTSDEVHFQLKFSVPFASLIFSVLGACVGIRPARSTSSIGFGLSLLIIIIYYILVSVGMGLALAHLLSPFWSAWLPNILISLGGLVLFRRVINGFA